MTWPFADDVSDATIAAAAERYAAATPFEHVVLDGWFRNAALYEVSALFSEPTGWQSYEDGKSANAQVLHRPFFQALHSADVLALIARITGQAVVPDPTLRGGGLHRVPHGGRLGIHVDFNRHPTLPLERVVNTILYLNPSWDPRWQGSLTLTDRQDCTVHIEPTWNRWVIFKYGPASWHGHPEPLACPTLLHRRSAAVYYYRPLVDDVAFTGTTYA